MAGLLFSQAVDLPGSIRKRLFGAFADALDVPCCVRVDDFHQEPVRVTRWRDRLQ
jgi:hypothetical protein